MSADGQLLLLDTSVILHLMRGKATGLAIDATYSVRARPDLSLVSVISVGEVLAFAAQRGWGNAKINQVKKFFEGLAIVDLRNQVVLQRYAEIDSYLVKNGCRIGDNDTWIAATAAATGATLLTTDKDFDSLHGHLITRIWFDPQVSPAAGS